MVHVVDFVESTRNRHTKHFYNELQEKKASRGHSLLGYLFQNVLSLKFAFLDGHWVHLVDLEIFITSRITSVNNKEVAAADIPTRGAYTQLYPIKT